MNTVSVTPQAASDLRPAHPVLVDAQWLEAHLSDPDVRVVEVDVSRAAYDEGHIDGAVLWNVYADVKDANYRTADADALQQLARRSGIDRDSTVVFYGYAPALGFWLMTLYGHPDVRILDCSRATWRAGGRPWSSSRSQPTASAYLIGNQNPRVRADRAAVAEAIGRPEVTVLDVRSAAEYRGERFWPSGGMEEGGHAGRVPSAVHQPLEGLYHDDGSFCPAAELAEVFTAVPAGADGDLITYCTIGGRAATAWFVLTYLLGRERVRVYDGSWAEWGRTAGVPVATG
jgi:thiosulfate/3-mercaptopyruvate sulfurtransferase